jgi:hypothetical protein
MSKKIFLFTASHYSMSLCQRRRLITIVKETKKKQASKQTKQNQRRCERSAANDTHI